MNAPRAPLAAVVLAAGGSTRMGRPKQLLEYGGLPLVARAANAVLGAGCDPVVVVLGSDAEAVRAALAGLPVLPVLNPGWTGGMGTSLAAGVRAVIERAPEVHGVLVALADQPLVDAAALARLADAWAEADLQASGSPEHEAIAAAAYSDTVGVPAVFGRAHFDRLLSLPPDTGAAALLRAPGTRPRRVPMPDAGLDVDAPDDLVRLRERGRPPAP